MRRKRNNKVRKLADRVGAYVRAHPTALIGGTIAAGFLATRLLVRRRNRIGNADAFHITDADRALEFQPRGNQERDDVVGDPSARTSVGLDTLAAERERL